MAPNPTSSVHSTLSPAAFATVSMALATMPFTFFVFGSIMHDGGLETYPHLIVPRFRMESRSEPAFGWAAGDLPRNTQDVIAALATASMTAKIRTSRELAPAFLYSITDPLASIAQNSRCDSQSRSIADHCERCPIS